MLLALLIAMIALAAIRGGSRSMGDVRTGDMPAGTARQGAAEQAQGAAGQGAAQPGQGAGGQGAAQPGQGVGGEGGAASRKPPSEGAAAPMESGGVDLCSWAQYRLPRVAVVPQFYNLTLNVSMEGQYPVEGEVSIAVDIQQVGARSTCMAVRGLRVGGCMVRVRSGGWGRARRAPSCSLPRGSRRQCRRPAVLARRFQR